MPQGTPGGGDCPRRSRTAIRRFVPPEVEFQRDKAKFLAFLHSLIGELARPVADDRMGDLRAVASTLADIADLELHWRLGFSVMPLYVTEQKRDGTTCRYIIWNKPRSGGGEVHYEGVIPGFRGCKGLTVRSTGMAKGRRILVEALGGWIAETNALISLPPLRVLGGHVQGTNPRLANDAYHRCLEAAISKLERKPSILRIASEAMDFIANRKLRLLHEHFLPGEPRVFGYREEAKMRTTRYMVVHKPDGEPQLELRIGVTRPTRSHGDQAADITQVLRAWQDVRQAQLGIDVGAPALPPGSKPTRRRKLPDPNRDALLNGLRELRERNPKDRITVPDMLRVYGLEEVELKRFMKSTRFVARAPRNNPHQLPGAKAPRARGKGGEFISSTTWTRRQAIAAAEGWAKKLGVSTDPF